MKKQLLWMGILLPCLMLSCKDDFADSIGSEMKDADSKIEKVSPAKPGSISSDKRKDKDWETGVS